LVLSGAAYDGLTALAVLAGVVIRNDRDGDRRGGAVSLASLSCAKRSGVLHHRLQHDRGGHQPVAGDEAEAILDPVQRGPVHRSVSIAITGIVFQAVLSKLLDLESRALVADKLTHMVLPIMGVLGWLLYGPRGMISRRTVWLSVACEHGKPGPELWVDTRSWGRIA
jgi:hypothetical protein